MQLSPWLALAAVLVVSLWVVGVFRRSARTRVDVRVEAVQEEETRAKDKQPRAPPKLPLQSGDDIPVDAPPSVLFNPKQLIDELKGLQSACERPPRFCLNL
jgi:hypothetical protein